MYDRCVFSLDGRVDLDVSFKGITMRTPIYIKVEAADKLLLGEGVCRQLKIITYHPSVSSKKYYQKDNKDQPALDAKPQTSSRSQLRGPVIPEGIKERQNFPGVRRHSRSLE